MIAERHAAVVCQAASVLLRYPDEGVRDRVPLVTEAVTALPPGAARSALTRFLEHLADTSPRDLAEHYVATFDRRRRCCLYLTWWTDGETRRRGQALAALKDRYRSSCLELGGSELPDYLPVVLEYAAIGDLADGLALLQEHRAGIELLRLALRDAGSPYTAVVEAVCALLPGPSPQDRAAAQRLARSGPPQETVGLELEPYDQAPSGGARR
ncbi:nitrate reductase molybdenum cofactor assembly chaperone [Streptomyces sp.]|uniref:nitrate reductase molybdenum cofactor assembly chaperone n=1 Tax=Streptomyces sp. TaxID=1931 RepID=UPI002D78F34D|nr:nitrate reductase molybdenum cofactor assembly chaperone [Streptomyces sp.]HET6359905.1 nitrate reductase molybdenum cofactor assembly chaperone [Streptomyces sp.]